jgi:hypothetical protein
LDATVEMNFRQEGLRCRIALPQKHLAPADRPEHFPTAPR